MLNEVLLVFGTLFPIVNPFSTALIFNQLTHGVSKKQKSHIILLATIVSLITMVVFLFLGNALLNFFNITIYAFRVAGGLYLARIGFGMLAPSPIRKPENYQELSDSIAFVPLAIPLLSGPGALTSVLVMSAEYTTTSVIIAIALIALVSWIVLSSSRFIEQLLSQTGANVLERILGLIVLVIAIQFVFNGITGYIQFLGVV